MRRTGCYRYKPNAHEKGTHPFILRLRVLGAIRGVYLCTCQVYEVQIGRKGKEKEKHHWAPWLETGMDVDEGYEEVL